MSVESLLRTMLEFTRSSSFPGDWSCGSHFTPCLNLRLQIDIKTCQTELNRIFRSCPDRPRASVAEIDQRCANLETERETTSMSLAREKDILKQIHKLQRLKAQVAEYHKFDEQIKAQKVRERAISCHACCA